MTDSALKSDGGAAAQPQSWSLFYGSPIVTIEVGQGERCRSFQVARDILTKNSPVMAAMLEGDFQEAHSRTCKLPQFDPDAYAAFLTALHVVTLRAGCGLAGGELAMRLTFFKTNSMLEWVAQVGRIADYYGCDIVRDHIRDTICDKMALHRTPGVPDRTRQAAFGAIVAEFESIFLNYEDAWECNVMKDDNIYTRIGQECRSAANGRAGACSAEEMAGALAKLAPATLWRVVKTICAPICG